MIVDKLLAKTWFDRESQPMLENNIAFKNIGISVVKIEFPIIDVGLWWRLTGSEILLRVLADDYHYLPVQGWWINQTGVPLLSGSGQVPSGGGFQVSGHPSGKNRTWFCFPGWREYHDHPGHQSPTWVSIRSQRQYRIPGIIVQLLTDLNKSGVSRQ